MEHAPSIVETRCYSQSYRLLLLAACSPYVCRFLGRTCLHKLSGKFYRPRFRNQDVKTALATEIPEERSYRSLEKCLLELLGSDMRLMIKIVHQVVSTSTVEIDTWTTEFKVHRCVFSHIGKTLISHVMEDSPSENRDFDLGHDNGRANPHAR